MPPENNPAVTPQPPRVEVTTFEDAREAWTCPHLSAGLSGPGEEHFHLGTVMRIDGAQHASRRKAMATLLSRRGHQHFRERWLFPAVDAGLAEVLAHPDPDGIARVNLRRWSLRVNQQLAAALTGLDGGTTPEGAQRLFELMEVVLKGRPQAFDVTLGSYNADTPQARASLAAKQTIIDEFYTPSLRRRLDIAERLRSGKATADEMPQDLVALIATGADAAWTEPAMGEREAIFLLAAAVHTTSATLIWVLREMFEWAGTHAAKRQRLTDPAFILRATQEALRLHPVVPGFPRLATEDVTLKSANSIAEGSIAILRSGPANSDSLVFGDRALEFHPDREVRSGVPRFGLAFGMGAHMCFGMPIVLGTGGMDGSLVYVLKKLLDAGIEPDETCTVVDLRSTRGRFATNELGDSYLVKFATR